MPSWSSRWTVLALFGILILLLAAILIFRLGTTPSSTQLPATSTPLSAPTAVPRFRVTSQSIRNAAGINIEPGMRPSVYSGPNPDGWWCNLPTCARKEDPTTLIDREMALAARLHVGVVRVEFDWPFIEPSRGTFRWSRADEIVLAANKYGVQLQPVLLFTPSWAGSSYIRAPTSTASWTQFVEKVVSRYKNSVHYWELWNEPDGPYWQSGTDQYVHTILVPGYRAARKADPLAHILLGEPYFADSAFLNEIYSSGGGNSFDIAGFHEYASALSPGAVQGDVATVQKVLDAHHQSSKPVWVGEYGYPEPSATVDDVEHIQVMKIMLQEVTGYAEAIWYNLRDDDAMNCCPPSTVKKAHWGVVQRNDSTLKRGYATMRKLIAVLPRR